MQLIEGQAGACHAYGEDIIYPLIKSCMTMTVVYSDPAYVVSGHSPRLVLGMASMARLTVAQTADILRLRFS
ncbi:hypothetical protein JWH11_09625 [Xanthomonas melonis]|uniref:Uncharacterized protein n=1 Tax=Xanthomonas melonis TaxID=56456 RepID=A0A2S7DE35_9XANT|nr:hypothetical protein [Xanthomonas melonis]MCC4600406.1 hypothetical protein [Xanthomonas melonis]MCD0258464.1 hypothetical protein [Xanthomonas melonis]MCD0266685.1 hypothetical protein [Xanthomonas melonis]MCD0278628.1 hypothetical protein [Xanthomonas melonis]PPU72095.1 hypothetical protein XmelCFBP4644_13870 [Xanthomonas melonis]